MGNRLSRRAFIRASGLGVVAATVVACTPSMIPRSPESGTLSSIPTPTALRPIATSAPGTAEEVDVELALTALPREISILSGQPTAVWRFEGQVLQGDPAILESLPDSYLGPILHLQQGQRVRIHFTNQIPQESIIHWHGLHVPADMDGHPRYVIGSGESYVYEFTVLNRAGTYWYHPHPHGRTGPQVYAGMAGLILITDSQEQALDLPRGEFDLPLVLQDRTFDAQNRLVYLPNGPMEAMTGFLGERILVNGQADASRTVAPRAYRLRLLNGSNSRIYKLGWSNGMPMTVIGTDGGLLEQSVQRPYIILAPAERVELWVDFGQLSADSVVTLENQPFEDPSGGMGMMGGMMGGGNGSALGQGERYAVARFRVSQGVGGGPALPEKLATVERIAESEAQTARTVALAMQPPSGWTLNGRTFEMNGVVAEERVRLGATEVWAFDNQGGMGGGMGRGMMGGMGTLPHPIHMHGQPFQVLERQVSQEGEVLWNSLREGFVDEGWKDTVLVLPGQQVRVIRRFEDFTGRFLYHCHNLEHEDMGMMRNFEVIPS